MALRFHNGVCIMDFKAFDLVRQMAASHYLVRSLHVVAELGIADGIGEDATPIADIARRSGSNVDAISRALRLLSSRGIFEVSASTIRHTAASRFLRSDDPASLRPLVRMFGQTVQWQTAGNLKHSIITGDPAITQDDGGLWGYFARNPADARVFDAAMAAKASVQISDLLASHDFSQYRRVVDVGGGQGHFLRAVIERHQQVIGVLFDLPSVIAGAPQGNERLELVGGDFFEADLPAGDAVVMMEVLHDWNDEDCDKILQGARRAMAPESRLIIVEIELHTGNDPEWPKLLDIVMLGVFAARQRTNDEYRAMLTRNGFAVTSQISTPGELTVVTAQLTEADLGNHLDAR